MYVCIYVNIGISYLIIVRHNLNTNTTGMVERLFVCVINIRRYRYGDYFERFMVIKNLTPLMKFD